MRLELSMFIIDLIIKNTAASLSVQRKETADAESLYKQILDAVNSGSPKLLELTCEKQPDKKIAIVTSDIAAVQLTEKSGATTSSGRPPGFFALASE